MLQRIKALSALRRGHLSRRASRLVEAREQFARAASISRRLDVANAVRPFAILKERTGDAAGALQLWKEAHRLYSSAKAQAGIDESASHLQKLGG